MFRHDFGRCPLDHTVLTLLDRDFLIGATLAGRYVIERCVGEGGMGRVYRAHHRNLDRLFAIKVLYGDLAADSKMRQRFEREARAASRVDHPHLVSVLDFGITDTGLLYLVMTYVDGRELGEVIEEEAPFAPERVHRLARQLCQGLAHAHDLGLVHRDFKGQNVLVSGQGEDEHARILDFGLAFMRQEPGSARLTTEGVVMGTPAYMSPEQSTNQPLDHRTDLFSLGVLIYEMLAGTLPFDGTPVELARQNLAADAPPISRRVRGLAVDPGLERIAHRLMRKLPADRFQSAHEVMAALGVIAAEDQDTHSVPVLDAPPAASGTARRRASTGGPKPAAAEVDAVAPTESLDQAEVSAPVAVPVALRPVAPPVAYIEAQGAPAQAGQPARAGRAMYDVTERVRDEDRRTVRAVEVVAALALLAAAVIALLVWHSTRDAEIAQVAPGTTEPAPAEIRVPVPAEVAAPAPAEVAVPAPAEVAPAAPDAASEPAPVAPGPPRTSESRRSRNSRNRAEPDTEPDRPSAGSKEPGSKEPGGKVPNSKVPGGKEPAAALGAASDLETLYKRVGEKLNAFERERGAAAARPLWDEYSAIPLLDAMRTPSLGQDAMRTLRRIERDMAAARPAP